MSLVFEEYEHLLCQKNWKNFKAKNALLNAKNLSRDENSVGVIVSSSHVARAYAYIGSIAYL